MKKKFESVPTDKNTLIQFQLEASLGEYEVLYQKWIWDGITGESFIFSSEDVSKMTNDELAEEVRISPMVKKDSEITFKRSETGFTFVNFNFKT